MINYTNFGRVKMAIEKRFQKDSMIILWTEAVLFSVVFGIAYRSVVVPVILFSVLFVLLRSPKRIMYAIVLLSLLWGIIFAALGYDGGGWIWALVLGGFVFYKGVRIHLRDLKQDDVFAGSFSSMGLVQNWNFGRHNLNWSSVNWTKSEQALNTPWTNPEQTVPGLFILGVVTLSLATGFWAKAPKTVPDHPPPTISF